MNNINQEFLKKEFEKHFRYVPELEDGRTRDEVCDWWLAKFDTHHDQLLTEVLEETGENIEYSILSEEYAKEIFNSPREAHTFGINQERSRIRSILLAKKRKE